MWVPTVITYMIKKELDVYLRVPGSSDQNTDLFAFGEHPSYDALGRRSNEVKCLLEPEQS